MAKKTSSRITSTQFPQAPSSIQDPSTKEQTLDLIRKILVAGETDLAQELTAALLQEASRKRGSSLPTIKPEAMPRKKIYNFWMSPEGVIYPVNKFYHDDMYEKLADKFYKNPSDAWEDGTTLYDKGWVSGHNFDHEDGEISFGRYSRNEKLTQRQLDTMFDWFLALKKSWDKTDHKDWRSFNALGILQFELQKQGMKTKISSPSTSQILEASLSLKTIKPKDLARKRIYNFFVSPYGEVYPVKPYKHDDFYEKVSTDLYGDPRAAYKPGRELYDIGWVSAHFLDDGGFLNTDGYLPGATKRNRLNQRLLDTLFDIYLAYKNELKKKPKDYLDASKLEGALSVLQHDLKSFGLKLASSSPKIEVTLDSYKNDLHYQLQDYLEDTLFKRERNLKKKHDPVNLADRIEAVLGKSLDTTLLRKGKLKKEDPLYKALLEAREDLEVDSWTPLFNLMKEFSAYMETLEQTSPEELKKSYAREEANIAKETTKIVQRFLKELEAAIKRVRMPADKVGFDRIKVSLNYKNREFGREDVSLEPVTSFYVELGSHHSPPSFTAFTNDQGKIEDLGDVLEGGDTEFFKNPDEQSFYFDLVKEIRKPGSTHRPGKNLTLYTARPLQDRRLYERARRVPVNIFLTSDPNRAAGIAHDLGGSEVRDVWRVRINEQYLVTTLDTPRVKDYQTVGGNGREVPVKDLELFMEGKGKYGSMEMPPPGFLEGSVFKDSVYHGTNQKLTSGTTLRPDQGKEFGIYLTPNHRYARQYGRHLVEALVHMKKPLVVEGKYEISPKDLTKQDVADLQRKGYDGIVVTSSTLEKASEIVAFEPSQVWVLTAGGKYGSMKPPSKKWPKGILLHGTSKNFDRLKPMLDDAIYLSDPNDYGWPKGRPTQAEHIAYGPFGGYLLEVRLRGGKEFNPYSDPVAEEIRQKYAKQSQHQFKEGKRILYNDAYVVIRAAKKHGYNVFRFYEPAIRGDSIAVTDPSLLKVVRKHQVKPDAEIHKASKQGEVKLGKSKVYYHGTPTEKAARKIMREGIKPSTDTRSHSLAPQVGKVYLTPQISYGIIYALGGDMAGSSLPSWMINDHGQYGYLFEVPANRVKNLTPDEDSIGEMLHKGDVSWLNLLAEEILEGEETAYPEDYIEDEDDPYPRSLLLLDLVKEGEYLAWAESGKILEDYMTQDQKLDLIQKGAHIAHSGKVRPTKCWRIDRNDSPKLKRNGSNFFKYAEPCTF